MAHTSTQMTSAATVMASKLGNCDRRWCSVRFGSWRAQGACSYLKLHLFIHENQQVVPVTHTRRGRWTQRMHVAVQYPGLPPYSPAGTAGGSTV